MRDYISVGESLFHKLLSAHSCTFMSELYFCFFILYSAESSVTRALILAEIPVNSASAGNRQICWLLAADCELAFERLLLVIAAWRLINWEQNVLAKRTQETAEEEWQ